VFARPFNGDPAFAQQASDTPMADSVAAHLALSALSQPVRQHTVVQHPVHQPAFQRGIPARDRSFAVTDTPMPPYRDLNV